MRARRGLESLVGYVKSGGRSAVFEVEWVCLKRIVAV